MMFLSFFRPYRVSRPFPAAANEVPLSLGLPSTSLALRNEVQLFCLTFRLLTVVIPRLVRPLAPAARTRSPDQEVGMIISDLRPPSLRAM